MALAHLMETHFLSLIFSAFAPYLLYLNAERPAATRRWQPGDSCAGGVNRLGKNDQKKEKNHFSSFVLQHAARLSR